MVVSVVFNAGHYLLPIDVSIILEDVVSASVVISGIHIGIRN